MYMYLHHCRNDTALCVIGGAIPGTAGENVPIMLCAYSGEVRARDAVTTRSSLAQGWSKGRVQTGSAGVPLHQRSGTTLPCQ